MDLLVPGEADAAEASPLPDRPSDRACSRYGHRRPRLGSGERNIPPHTAVPYVKAAGAHPHMSQEFRRGLAAGKPSRFSVGTHPKPGRLCRLYPASPVFLGGLDRGCRPLTRRARGPVLSNAEGGKDPSHTNSRGSLRGRSPLSRGARGAELPRYSEHPAGGWVEQTASVRRTCGGTPPPASPSQRALRELLPAPLVQSRGAPF